MNLIKANKDESVLIKEIAKNCIHVRLTKTHFDPNDPRVQNAQSHIAVYSIAEFETMEKNTRGSMPIDWVKVSGFDAAKIVHDGRLEPKEETAPVKPEPTVDQAVKAAVRKETAKANIRRNLANKGKETA